MKIGRINSDLAESEVAIIRFTFDISLFIMASNALIVIYFIVSDYSTYNSPLIKSCICKTVF